MLEPRSATGPAGSRPAIAATSSAEPAPSAPALAPWPRWSKATAAIPAARHARATSKWLSLQDPAPCSTTTPPSGSRSGRNRAKARPSRVPSSSGGCTWTLRTAWHDAPPMAAVQQLSPVYPLGSTINERGVLEIGGGAPAEGGPRLGPPAHRLGRDGLPPPPPALAPGFPAPPARLSVALASPAV